MNTDLEVLYSKYNPLCNQNITSVIVFGSPLPNEISQPDRPPPPSPPPPQQNTTPLKPNPQPEIQHTANTKETSNPESTQPVYETIPPKPVRIENTNPPVTNSLPVTTLPVTTSPVITNPPVPDTKEGTEKNTEKELSDSDLSFRLFGSTESSNILRTLQEKIGSVKASIIERIEKVHQTQTLSQNITQLLLQKQYDTASYRLPVVIKEIQSTPGVKPPRGLYYINRNGRKIYLNESQRRKWKQGDEIAGCIKGCSAIDLNI
jgi:hypothetical protein